MTASAIKHESASTIKKAAPSTVFSSENHPLDPLFSPQSVAVIGASERAGSVGRSVLWNLLSSPFGGTVFPVNAKRSNVLGIKAYPSVRELPDKVDLVVLTTPADTVPDLIAESVELGVPAAIVISAGFKEYGEHGKELERQISEVIRGKMRLIGPNCLGVMNPIRGFNANLCPHGCATGKCGFHQPERRALHRSTGLESA
jgi:acetyltransferase